MLLVRCASARQMRRNADGRDTAGLFLALGASGGDLARGHEVADVFLEELVVVVELVVFFPDGLDPVEYGE